MRLKVIGTGSGGNCYLLESQSDTLMIECGVRIKDIKVGIDFDFQKVSGCIITHEHNDHAKSIKELIKAGVDVYATKGTLEAKHINDGHIILPKQKYQIGSFTVMPFSTVHDAADPVGFLIDHIECGLTLFLTDTSYVEYKFLGLNNIIIEANYDLDIIRDKYGKNTDLQFLKNRVIKSHFSIDNCIEMLKVNDLTKVNNIVLIHLSDSNSNEVEFKQKVEHATGKTVNVAAKGMEIEFNATPF